MRALGVLLALTVGMSGCGVKTCKSNTVLVDVTFDGVAASANQLQVNITVGGVTHTQSLSHSTGMSSGSIEVDFAKGYPTGKQVTVMIQASANGAIVGAGMGTVTASGSCQALAIEVKPQGAGVMSDMSTIDLIGTIVDMPTPDLLPQPPDFAGCGYVFVSATTGADGNSGCDPTVPKQTIGAALGVNSAHDILICKGSYHEDIHAARAVTLRGAYDCATWTRTASFGYPKFDSVNETILQGVTPGKPALIASVASVEGLTVKAANGYAPGADLSVGGSAGSFAVQSQGNGAGSIHDNKVLAGTAIGNGTVALNVSGTGGDVFHNLIDGGTGTVTTSFDNGTVAVMIGAQSHVHDNIIHPGTGSATAANASGVGAIGIYIASDFIPLTKANGNAVENNIIKLLAMGMSPLLWKLA